VYGVPFYVAAPWSTIDMQTPSGTSIPIEERSPDEVLTFGGARIAPVASPARNWGFDVTPARFITSLITDRGIVGADTGSIAAVDASAR
jgi:methylthioribose-1-phosphate isomerase